MHLSVFTKLAISVAMLCAGFIAVSIVSSAQDVIGSISGIITHLVYPVLFVGIYAFWKLEKGMPNQQEERAGK